MLPRQYSCQLKPGLAVARALLCRVQLVGSAILPTFTSGAPNHCRYGNEGLLEWGERAVCKPAGSGRALSEILQKISLDLAINTLFLRLNMVCEIEEQ